MVDHAKEEWDISGRWGWRCNGRVGKFDSCKGVCEMNLSRTKSREVEWGGTSGGWRRGRRVGVVVVEIKKVGRDGVGRRHE